MSGAYSGDPASPCHSDVSREVTQLPGGPLSGLASGQSIDLASPGRLPYGGDRARLLEGAMTTMQLTSPQFAHRGEMPSALTCEGGNRAPALAWSGLPEGTRSLALVVDDPDAPDPRAPMRVFVHWVIWNIPASTTGLPDGVTRSTLPMGAMEGRNDRGQTGYTGPCPPIGRHRYFFKLYALDSELKGLNHPTKAQLEAAMEGHILAKTELLGTYKKKAP